MTRPAMHDDEIPIDAATVRRLVAEQFPDLADLPVERVAADGTVHATFRIGDGWSARLPLRGADPDDVRLGLAAEIEASVELRAHLSVPVPAAVGVGLPGAGYPLPWSVWRWLPGATATDLDPGGSTAFADDLADLVAELRSIPTSGRIFAGSGRGGRLPDHDGWVATCLERSRGLLPVDRLARLWAGFRSLPRRARDVMCHGDLVPGNVLVDDGRLAGLLDVGSYGAADPSLDLVAAWHLLEADPREHLRERLSVADVEWRRGMAWAFQQAVGLVWYYETTNPPMSRLGRRTLGRLLDAAG